MWQGNYTKMAPWRGLTIIGTESLVKLRSARPCSLRPRGCGTVATRRGRRLPTARMSIFQEVNVLVPQGGEPGDILGFRLDVLAMQMGERRVHVQGVPEHHRVDDQSQRPELVFLALAISLADLPPRWP